MGLREELTEMLERMEENAKEFGEESEASDACVEKYYFQGAGDAWEVAANALKALLDKKEE